MVLRCGSGIGLVLWTCIAVGACAAGGCKKTSPGAGSGTGEIALSGGDLNPDGTITPQGMQNIESEASHEALEVNFIRAPLSDAGLQQLAKFRNLRHVQAVGSRITNDGIAKLKRAIPEVEVAK